jgi:hypothetical protein
MVRSQPRALAIVSLLVLAALSQRQLHAQSRDSLEARLALPSLPAYQPPAPLAPILEQTVSIVPGLTLLSPNAFSADGLTVWGGVGYQQRTRFVDNADGAVYIGLGLGDAAKYMGIALTAASYSTINSGFFDRIGFSVQLNRFIGTNTAVGVGAENFAIINRDEGDASINYYGVATHVFTFRKNPSEPFSFLTATLGVGSGRFRAEEDVFAGKSTVGAFGALSLHVIRAAALVADWYGQDLALGISLAPFPHTPIVISPGLYDVTHSAGDGARFGIAVGFGYRFNSGVLRF